MKNTITGAVIVAAGMSTRMGDFKPLLPLGGKTLVETVVETFQSAGVAPIVMVTGYRAEALERHLAGKGIRFVRNERYESTDMFESVRIGIESIQGACDRLFFTPADVPLFSLSTLETLMKTDAQVACPVCQRRAGHPILLDAGLIPALLKDRGEEGLKGALGRCAEERIEIPVTDVGILYDADTPEDYRALQTLQKN